jgi:hypothetical protein
LISLFRWERQRCFFHIALEVVPNSFYSPLKDRSKMSFRNRPYEGSGAELCDGPNEFDRASGRFVWRISSVNGTLLMVLAIAAGSIGLTSFASFVARQDRLAASGKDPLDAIVIRSEVIHLYLPRTLIELGNHQTQQPPLQTHEELRRSLEVQQHRDLWYALTVRGFQVNGEFADTTFIRRPYAVPDRFAEFLEIMAAATASPPDLWKNLSSATVHLIPDEFSERDPREVITKLIGQSPPPIMSDSPPR